MQAEQKKAHTHTKRKYEKKNTKENVVKIKQAKIEQIECDSLHLA